MENFSQGQNFFANSICVWIGHIDAQKGLSGIDFNNCLENTLETENQILKLNSLTINTEHEVQNKTSDFVPLAITNNNPTDPLEGNFKNKQKTVKKKKIMQIPQLFESYFYYMTKVNEPVKLDNIFEYTMRRNMISIEGAAQKIDLGLYNLREIVEFCMNHKLISNEVYLDFTFQSGLNDEVLFMDKLNKKHYDQIDLKKLYFTPFDHRMLAKLLSDQFPSQFQFPRNIILENKKLNSFYNYLYWLSDDEYNQTWECLNQKFCRIWMPKSIEKLQKIVSFKLQNKPNIYEEDSFSFGLHLKKLRRKL